MDDASRPSVARLSGIATAPGQNMPDAFLDIRRSFQAREILIALEKHGPGNDALFYAWLGTIGLGPSHRDLADPSIGWKQTGSSRRSGSISIA